MNLQRKTILSLLLVCVSIFTGCAKMDLKADRFTLEIGEDPADYASQYVSVKGADLEDVNFDFSKVNTDKVGEALEITDVITRVTEKSKEVTVKYSDKK